MADGDVSLRGSTGADVYLSDPASSPNIFVNVAGDWKQASNVYVNVAGTWKEVTDLDVNVAGTWKGI